MLLKSIKLSNIRSYLNEKIEFPAGSVMLSGDIGSGKSTILLAAEFALFGIMKGDVSGESLLRHGKKEGSVEICLEINRKETIIHRELKRAKQGVKQDSGYIITDGIKKQATSTELKAAILEILGYPKDLLTKSKELIYRYTVYTPQEEMKKIIFEDKESRLNTLRRVFEVDKYKRIRENAKTYIIEIKGSIKEIEGFITDLEEKKEELNDKEKEVKEIEKKIALLKPSLEKAKQEVEKHKKNYLECEKSIQKLADLKRELAMCDIELKSKVSQRLRNKNEIERISKNTENLEKELEGQENIEGVSSKIKEKENEAMFMDETRLKISQKIAEMNSKKHICDDTKNKISKLDNCPTCLQKVPHEHKKGIIETEYSKIKQLEEEIKIHEEQGQKAGEAIKRIRQELEELRKKEKLAEALKVKTASLKEQKSIAENLGKEQEEIKKSIGSINSRKIKISEELNSLQDAEQEYKKIRALLEESQRKERQLEIENNTFQTEIKGKLESIKSMKEGIAKKELAKSKLQKTKNLQHWLETHFTSLMALMEKQVMAKVYHLFNELFQSWFSTLMEDESITARLDDTFTPVIQQNGFETSMGYLSGGEKTSCALAYRLSLNKVINDLITTINTKNIIILDEPTDGFSTEQLDRVREVIDQLNMGQIIIVSHEQKMEGFVDSVIRIQKNEHVSSVA